MNAASAKIRNTIARAWRRMLLTGDLSWQHMGLLRAEMRLMREEEKRLNDALAARLLSLEERLGRDEQTLLSEWDAIEHSSRSTATKWKALRALYATAIRLRSREAPTGDSDGA